MGTIGVGKRQGQSRLGESRADLAPTEHPTNHDILWGAGVFEGEGCCTDPNTGLTVGQKARWLCDRMRALFGGSVGERHKKYKGEDYVYYCWYLNGARARGFLMTIYKFMSPKRQEEIKRYLSHGR